MIKGIYREWFIQLQGDCMFAYNPKTDTGMVGDSMTIASKIDKKYQRCDSSTLTTITFVPESKRLVV